jgi:hypothetical protein
MLAVFIGPQGAQAQGPAYDLTKVRNKFFEKDSNGDGIPNAWVPTEPNPGDKRGCNQSHSGSCSFKMVGNGTNSFLYRETLFSFGPAGVTATFSAWIRGKELIGAGASEVYMVFNHEDGSSNEGYITLTGGSSPWTFREESVVATELFVSMTVGLFTNEDSGKVWFDKVKLTAIAP